MLCAMLLSFLDKRFDEWNTAALQHLINVQHATLSYRADVLDVSDDVRNDAEALLRRNAAGHRSVAEQLYGRTRAQSPRS